MEFARKQLEKYGWTDGKGLGKNENGIAQALKPKLKRSMTGVGHDAASDFTEHWWSTLYDKAASNIEVKDKGGKTKKIQAKDENGFEITNSTWKLKRKKTKLSNSKPQEQYEDFFVRTAVLGSGGSRTERVRQSESESDEEPAQRDVLKMTDEELFAACEGRTAHKGARHGLKALGKLARIEEQEKQLLKESRFNGYSHVNRCTDSTEQQVDENISIVCEKVTKKLKKKMKTENCIQTDSYENQIEKEDRYANNFTKKQKKKNKNHSNCDIGELLGSNTNMCDSNTDIAIIRECEPLPQKVKKKKGCTIDEVNGAKIKKVKADFESDIATDKKHKKRKKL